MLFIGSFLMAGWFSTLTAQEKEKPGDFSGEWRTFYMHTVNKGQLKDFYALATGGKAGYRYTFREEWTLGATLYLSVNPGLQDLTIPDEATGLGSRYEAGLFDLQDLDDPFLLLPGELFVRYATNKHEVTVGRMKTSTPFLNPQDGRMIPTLTQGIWYQYSSDKTMKIQFGILNAIAPRSSDKFERIGESIGKFPTGRQLNGTLGKYAGNTSSDFMVITGAETSILGMHVQAWNYFVDNVFNATYVKPKFDLGQNKVKISVEWLHERRVNSGGNTVDSLRYFDAAYANVFGLQFEVPAGKSSWLVGYNHILGDGRFLFPREWGREGLFTFQKRERSEGSASNHSILVSYIRKFSFEESSLQAIVSAGHQWKPSVSQSENNKYAMPDYTHINLNLFFESTKIPGLKPELLLTYKAGNKTFPDTPAFVLNKIDMFQINMVLNYQF